MTMKKEKGILTQTYAKAKKALENNNPDLARDLFDFGILCVSNYRILDGMKAEDKVENVKLYVWLERYWYGLENNDLLL
jgi:hypothetical protein